MNSSNEQINVQTFDKKYNLYGLMLYRIGLVYLGSFKRSQDAAAQALSWLLNRKSPFKSLEQEKIAVTRLMCLICEKKARHLKNTLSLDPWMENIRSSSHIRFFSIAVSLPIKYKGVLYLHLYDGLDAAEISKILQLPEFLVASLISKGMNILQCTEDFTVDKHYYKSMIDKLEVEEGINKNALLASVSSYGYKLYLFPLQRAIIITALVIVITTSTIFACSYPFTSTSKAIEYSYLNKRVSSLTIDSYTQFDKSGVVFCYKKSGKSLYTGYAIENDMLRQLDTKHIVTSVDFEGVHFPVSFYYCINNNALAIMSDSYGLDDTYASVSPIASLTDKVMITLSWTNSKGCYTYPVIMDINTKEIIDFLAGCDILQLGSINHIKVNSDLSGAAIITNNGCLYYCDTTSSTLATIVNITNSMLVSLISCEDEYVYFSASYDKKSTAYFYKYHTQSGILEACFERSAAKGEHLLCVTNNTAILAEGDGTYCAINLNTLISTTIPGIISEDHLSMNTLASPNGKHVMFSECRSSNGISNLDTILIYNTDARNIMKVDLSKYSSAWFTNAFWFDDKHIALVKESNNYDDCDPSNMALYNDPEVSTAGFVKTSTSSKHRYTLWILDLNDIKSAP